MARTITGCIVAGWTITMALATPTVLAQDASQIERLERQLRLAEENLFLRANPLLSIDERANFEYGAVVTFGFYATDDIDQETHIFRNTDAQLYARLQIDGAHEFFGRIRYNYLDFNSGDDFDGLGDEYRYPLADRWWYRFDLRRASEAYEGKTLDYNFTLQVGRQWIDWGSALALSEQLYAIQAGFELGFFRLDTLVGMTPASSVVDFDSSRPHFDADTEREFYGATLTYTGIADHRPYIYVLHQNDANDEDSAVISFGTPVVLIPTRFDYDSTYVAIGSRGRLGASMQYAAEVIHEFGEGLSSSLAPRGTTAVAQTREDIEAWAGKFELNYLFKDPNETKLEFETIIASGDADRDLDTSDTFGGNRAGTKDKAFNGFGFARTGFAFGAPISNLLAFRLGASTFPAPGRGPLDKLRLGVDLLWFNKLENDAPIDEATSHDHNLGYETDFYAVWRVTSDVSINLRYGVFFPGPAIETDNDPRHFFYSGISYAF